MVRRLLWAMVCAGVLATSTAKAGYKGGNDLHGYCNQGTDAFNQGACVGYIVGFADALFDLQMAKVFVDRFERVCMPNEKVTAGQVVDIVKKYLNDNPEDRHSSGTMIVLTALREAFPCKK